MTYVRLKKIAAACISLACMISGMISLTASAEPYENYNYDRWNDPIPSQAGYTAERSVSGSDLGAGEMDSPSDIFYGADGLFYIADSGNNRIIAADENFTEAVRIYDRFIMPDGSETFLKNPTGIFISAADNNMYIADSENSRVLVSDNAGNVIKEITKPESEIFNQKRTFTPLRVIVDKAGNVYAVLNNITTGVAMFKPDGEFTGFYGANRVQPTSEIISDHLTGLFMSEEKRARRVRNVPSGVTNFDIDGDFIFTCTSSATQTTDTVKKLNAAGNNIFANMELNFGDYTPVYDTTRNKLLAPSIVDIDIADDGNINCLDFTTGRIFQYDEDCNLLFITGTIAKQTGGFDHAAAIESHGDKLFVADSMKNTVTIFAETEFGAVVHKASALHNGGYYDEALEPWREVLRLDGNYRRAHLGVALALLRQGDYKGAMKYAKLANAGGVYDKAFEGYRMELIRENFGTIVFSAMIIAAAASIIRRKIKMRRNSRNKGETS